MSTVRGKADVAGAIIAGGRAQRLGGGAKALIELQGRTILDRLLAVLGPRLAALVISANDPAPYVHTGLTVVADDEPDRGPLGGLAAALRWCRRPYLLAVAGDMPFIRPALIDLLLSLRTPDADVIVPVTGGMPQPLCALYARRVLPVALRRLKEGPRGIVDLLTDRRLNLRSVYEPELRTADPDLDSFININTPEDLARFNQ